MFTFHNYKATGAGWGVAAIWESTPEHIEIVEKLAGQGWRVASVIKDDYENFYRYYRLHIYNRHLEWPNTPHKQMERDGWIAEGINQNAVPGQFEVEIRIEK